MANKYIIHGATFNGDGTSSALATSHGGVGAWNDIAYLEGTTPAFGALASGDTVYIRSKDASGNNISRTLAANKNLGSASATAGNPIQWVLDGGTVWSGISGTLTYTTAANFYVSLLNYNNLKCDVQDSFVIINTASSPNAWNLARVGNCVVENVLFDASASTYINGFNLNLTDVFAVMVSCHYKIGTRYGNFIGVPNFSGVLLVNPDFELVYTQATPLFSGSYANIKVLGGRVRGSGATTGVPLTNYGINCGAHIFSGLQFPNSMNIADQNYVNGQGEIFVSGADTGLGAFYQANWGHADSRGYNNYPTLNSALPDSASTGWAWKLYSLATNTKPIVFQLVNKLYTGNPAVLTLTVNFLVANTMSLNKKNLWFDISYVEDSTGLRRTISTYSAAGEAHTSSSAAWSATTYGPISFNKFECSATLPSNIKKDSSVIVTVRGTFAAASGNDIVIIDPSVVGV